MSFFQQLDFKSLGDERGGLVSLESNKEIPFKVKRIYYIFGTKENVSRGFHAHKELKQVAVCVSGSCIMLLDDGNNKEKITLDSPTKGIVINKMIWREMHDFSSDCVLLVLASEYYDESDYIREYENFIKIVNLKTG
jgi:dTDP-4-dehydrorhamnose 3,5-epimerase-like enzyme